MSSPRFASALSTRHDGTLAIREAVEELSAGLAGRTPDLLILFVTHHHSGEFEALAARLGSLTGARVLIGCSGESLVARQQELEGVPAISLWAVACEDLQLTPLRLGAHPAEGWEADQEGPEHINYSGHPDASLLNASGSSLILLGDPFSFPMSNYLEHLGEQAPDLDVTGGMASGGARPGENALFLAGERLNSGAVGVILRGGIELTQVLSQAYRPVGEPWVITDCEGPLIRKLGGKAAAKVMVGTFEALPNGERELLESAPMLGIAWNPAQRDFSPSDFLAHVIRGVAPQEEAILIYGEPRRGQTIQFMIRDPKTAGSDLLEQIQLRAGPRPIEPHEAGALLFTCNARGSRMFVEPHHDIKRLHQHLGPDLPVAGFFAQGEIGRIGRKYQLHGFTASMAVFRACAQP